MRYRSSAGDYALRSETVIELLLNTIAEDDDIMARELPKHSIEFQVSDEDHYCKLYGHLRGKDKRKACGRSFGAGVSNWLRK